MEMDITALEEGKKSVNFLVMRDVFHEGNEGIPHCHVMGISFVNETNRGLRVDGVV